MPRHFPRAVLMNSTPQQHNGIIRPKATGAQAVDRALSFLRMVAAAPGDGVRLSDLAASSGLDRATVHRLLASLVSNELIDQDAVSKRYTLGLNFFTLAAAASNRHDLTEVAGAALRTLSEQTGDTTTLCLRSGLMLVCTDVATGDFPIKALPMDIGSRRPLGAGASGIAMLAALPDFEIEQTLQKSASRLAEVPGQDVASIMQAVAQCREQGYALAPEEPLARIMGLAVTLTNRRKRPEGTLSINGIPDRLSPDRVPQLLALLQEQARVIHEAMLRMPDSARHRTGWAGSRGK